MQIQLQEEATLEATDALRAPHKKMIPSKKMLKESRSKEKPLWWARPKIFSRRRARKPPTCNHSMKAKKHRTLKSLIT